MRRTDEEDSIGIPHSTAPADLSEHGHDESFLPSDIGSDVSKRELCEESEELQFYQITSTPQSARSRARGPATLCASTSVNTV